MFFFYLIRALYETNKKKDTQSCIENVFEINFYCSFGYLGKRAYFSYTKWINKKFHIIGQILRTFV